MTDTYTVFQLTTYIRDLFDLDPALQDVWVEGEISNFTRASSGHLYFTLKDAQSELRCVMWKSQAAWLAFEPQHGDAVLAHGRVAVYEARGQYQLVCDAIQGAGVGDLNRQFELLKAQLEAEGLFDPARKRPIPAFPRQIGIVTSPTTAAFQDIQNVLRRRYPLVEVILSPTPVQGSDAPPQIVAAIRRLNEHTHVDVILVARGGGSLEDLWCFNDENVVRAVANSRIPVVTGVGHEIDFTLVDFAADVRAPTPSAAAEVMTPDGPALRIEIRALAARLTDTIRADLDDRRNRLTGQARYLARLSPEKQIANARQRIDDLTGRLARRLRDDLARQRDRLNAQARALDAAHPMTLMRRGYAVVIRTGDGKRVTSAWDAAEGTSVRIALHDGWLTATVNKRETGE
jgi:exodeoxyribonuclease VII large subunit